MSGLRALQRRVAKLETARKPRPSLIVIWCGSFEAFADATYAEVMAGTLAGDFLLILDHLRDWESDGTWDRANAR